MLIQARQARTANTLAPRQQKATVAGGQIRWYYGPSLRLWLDGYADQRPYADVAQNAIDVSGAGVGIFQGTVANRPLRTVTGNASCWEFDGVTDRFDTSAIDLTTTDKVSVFMLNRKTAAASGLIFQIGNGAVINGGMQHYRDAALKFHGNSYQGATYNEQATTPVQALNSWICHTTLVDRSLAAAAETKLKVDGSFVTQTSVVLNDLTANFTNSTGSIGGWSLGSIPFGGQVAQVLVLNTVFGDIDTYLIAMYLRQRAGLI